MSNSGTYFVRVGSTFYIGSSTNLRKRKYSHLGSLMSGNHPNPNLQRAYSRVGSATFVPHTFMTMSEGEDLATFRTRLRDAEQKLLNQFKDDPGLANLSSSAFGPDNGHLLKKKWETREYREMMSALIRNREAPSDHTRSLMSEAKKGENNPRARKVEITCPDGSKKLFVTVTEAATFFKVKQQVMDLWVRGLVAWPGTGSRKPREQNRWIAEYSMRVV